MVPKVLSFVGLLLFAITNRLKINPKNWGLSCGER